MNEPSPRFLVLGGPKPVRLEEELVGVVDFCVDGDLPADAADGALVHATPDGVDALSQLRRHGGVFPIYALADGPVDVASRLQWIRFGADDLLDPSLAATTLRRRLQVSQTRRPDVQDEPYRRAFLQRWILTLQRYVTARAILVGELGEGGLARFLDAVRLRDFTIRSADPSASMADAFGQRRGAEREAIDWPITLVSPELGEGTLLNVGPDGMALSLDRMVAEHIVIRLDTGVIDATMHLDVRWQRRCGRSRWECGAIVTAIDLRRVNA